MNEIIEKLYLGSYEDAQDTTYLQSKGVTHILTVHERKLGRSYRENFCYKFIQTNFEIDLLSYFNDAIEFIKSGRADGGVLVHCQLGMSRSAAVIMAYVMFHDRCDEITALYKVKSRRRIVQPDDNLLTQLKLFKHMNYKLDVSLRIYRYYKNYFAISQKQFSNMILAPLRKKDGLSYYGCKNCGKSLFTQDNLDLHLNFMDDISIYISDYFEIVEASTEDVSDELAKCENGALYIEPMEWMSLVKESVHDLLCNECGHKVGHYSLTGEVCSCNKWVYPAIFIDKESVCLYAQ